MSPDSAAPKPSDASRLVVVGAGPAGMATAITLAERGLKAVSYTHLTLLTKRIV